jgi:DNA-binding XRE family transcriptional regulator
MNALGSSLIAFVSGGIGVERFLHRRFSSNRLHGEWFDLSPELEDLVVSAKSNRRRCDLLIKGMMMESAANETQGARFRRWRETGDLTKMEAAVRLKVSSPNVIGSIEADDYSPGLHLALDIEAVTGGAVRAIDWPRKVRAAEAKQGRGKRKVKR